MPVIGGDPFGGGQKQSGPPSPQEVQNFHTNSDRDAGLTSLHHTLGLARGQASSGSHTHNGKDSRKIASEEKPTLTGARGGNVALTNLINMLKPYFDFIDNTTP